MSVYLSVRDYGAVGDGVADDTAAIQAAVDEGARTGRTVYIDPGHYSVGEIFLHPASSLKAEAEWGFNRNDCGNAVLEQRFDDQKCILNVSEAFGATLDGLSLMGGHKPGGCCGILCNRPGTEEREDAFRIERCRVAGFTGDAVYLHVIWCFTARHNMFCFSDGDGLRMCGWDAFISDNWFSGNGGAGFGSDGENCSVTMTGNRIEWNRGGGIRIDGGSHYNITGNYIDRSGTAGIRLAASKDEHGVNFANTSTVTGNIIYRSGKFAETAEDSCHIYMSGCAGITCMGNSLCIGRDDHGKGLISPKTAMVLENLVECVVSGNTMFAGALETLILDKGGHIDAVIRDNVGSILPPAVLTADAPGFPAVTAADLREDMQALYR